MTNDAKPKQPKIVNLQFHLNIAEHDLEIKTRKIEEALSKGNHVKVQLQLRGREKSRPQSGVEWLTALIDRFKETATVNRQPTVDSLNIVLFPRKQPKSK